MPNFDTVVYNSLKRHNTNNLSYSMYKIDEKYVSCARLLTLPPSMRGRYQNSQF